MSEAIAAPQDTASLQAAEAASMMASFEAAHAAKPANDGSVPDPVVTKTVTVESKLKTADLPTLPTDAQEFPDEVLSGKAAPDPKKAEQEDDAILSERPTGQIKHDHFQRVQDAAKRKVDAAIAKADKYFAELETARKTAGKPSEDFAKASEATQKERDELRAELQRVAYERTPEFRERFTDREADLVKRAEETAKEFGIDAKVIKNALASSGKARFEILENAGELPASALSYLSNLLANHDQLQSEKAAVLSNSKERYVAYEQQQQAQAKAEEAQRKQREESAFNGVLEKLSTDFEPFKKVAGNNKWNAGIDEDIAAARKLYNDGNASEEQLAEVALTAIGAKKLHKMFKAVQTRLFAANAKIAELTAAGPHVNGNGQHRNLNDETGLSEEERIGRSFNESQRKFGLA